MKRMITNAVAIGIENWIGKNMVQIHQHCRQKKKIGVFPIIFEENFRNHNRENQMQKIMDDFADVEMTFHIENINHKRNKNS